jgi:hypothetical protein
MRAFQLWVALIVIHGFAAAQHFDFAWGLGVKGGFPTTDLLTSNRGATATLHQENNYIVGPMGEVRIPFGFALEVDGLYRRANYTVTNASAGFASIDSSSWEVPYIAKFRFPIPLLKPFLAGGGAYRTFNGLPAGITASHNAFVAAGGLELRVGKVRFSAEGRYLRWGSTPPTDFASLKRDQAEILFGFIFSHPQ